MTYEEFVEKAEEIFLNYDFGDRVVKDMGGWEGGCSSRLCYASRTVFLETDSDESEATTFTVGCYKNAFYATFTG